MRSETISKTQIYNCDGSTTTWDYDFKIYDEDHLELILRDPDGVESVIDPADYTVDGVGDEDGGTVTYPLYLAAPDTIDPIASGYSLVIRHIPPRSQTAGLRNYQSTNPAITAIETALDKLCAQIQYLDEVASRAVTVDITSTDEPEDYLSDVESSAAAATSSASSASTSASAASTSASNASTSATNAASSASAASTSASSASTSASAASTSASNASTSATSAASSASAAATSASSASTSETNAANSATSASNSASAAATSETNAATSATSAAASAAKLSGTSTSSVAIGTGSKSFTTQSSKFFDTGTWLLITSDANAANYMHGQVTAYSGTSLTVNVTNIGGSGTRSDWTIRVAGTQGATGSTGATGSAGSNAGINYTFNTNTASSDPGTGKLKFNNATLSSATALYISETDADSNGLGTWLATWDDSTNTVKGYLTVIKNSAPSTFAIFSVSGTLTDNGTWDTLTVAYVAGGGSFSNDDATRVFFTRCGDAGSLDINGLTADSSPDPNADYVASYDASASANKKVLHKNIKPIHCLAIACSDETTAITTGTAKVTFRMPYAFTLTDVRASVTTAPTGSTIIIDINEGGTTILSTKLSIDAAEKTSTTAASAAVMSDTSLADDAEMTIDFDQVGSTVAGAGVKVYLIGYRS